MFITGAASGIGKALALRVADESGVLHLTDLQSDRLQETVEEVRAGGGEVAFAEPADVSSYGAVQALAGRSPPPAGRWTSS